MFLPPQRPSERAKADVQVFGFRDTLYPVARRRGGAQSGAQ